MNDQALFAAALLDPDAPCPDGLTTWNGSDPARRFAVYRNNVIVSLIDALADTFPVTLELVGEAFFRAMAGIFVRRTPPRSTLLVDYGSGLPTFIERFEPAHPVPYLADVARLEMLRVRAFHAADADPLTLDQIAQALTNGTTACSACDSSSLAGHPQFALCSRGAVGSPSRSRCFKRR